MMIFFQDEIDVQLQRQSRKLSERVRAGKQKTPENLHKRTVLKCVYIVVLNLKFMFSSKSFKGFPKYLPILTLILTTF